uniref:Uncharacterized protein n=1 Tax=Trichobilharzia regenti TaxID=157069 RepID=A0AA85J6I2_TRIRE|nr:unnamed protein product [Trichobilharzia regenti]
MTGVVGYREDIVAELNRWYDECMRIHTRTSKMSLRLCKQTSEIHTTYSELLKCSNSNTPKNDGYGNHNSYWKYSESPDSMNKHTVHQQSSLFVFLDYFTINISCNNIAD